MRTAFRPCFNPPLAPDMTPPLIPPDWPMRGTSRHVACAPHLWHVQDLGSGPVVLLLHGAGGASHSFRHLAPLLAARARVIMVDLPGQGFTVLSPGARCSVDAMAEDLAALVAQQDWQPVAVIGHSAGAALALRLAELRPLGAVIGINAALGGFEGMAGWLFPVMARLLSVLPLVPQVFSRFAGTPRQVHQLLTSTGSRIEPAGEAQYLHLVRMPAHVSATLTMMAQWNLDGLLNRLPRQTQACLLITASADRAVPPYVSQRAADAIPKAQWTDLPNFGHLVHEEAAPAVATRILDFLESQGVLDPLPS